MLSANSVYGEKLPIQRKIMDKKKLTDLDRQTLEWNIRSIHSKLQNLEATRIKIERIYKQCGMGEEFYQEIDRIFSRLERSRQSDE